MNLRYIRAVAVVISALAVPRAAVAQQPIRRERRSRLPTPRHQLAAELEPLRPARQTVAMPAPRA